MEFHIQSDSLPRIIAKALFLTVISMMALNVLITVLVLIAMLVAGLEADWSIGLGKVLMLYQEFYQEKLLEAVWFAFGIFVSLCIPFSLRYWYRHDRLWIDEHGIRFVCQRTSSRSWQVAWKDIQLPVLHYVPRLFTRIARLDELFIQSRQPDNQQPPDKEKWRGSIFFGNSRSDNSIFILDTVSAWHINRAAGGYSNSNASVGSLPTTDQRPAVVHAIERYLRPGAIQSTHSVELALRRQANKTRYERAGTPLPFTQKLGTVASAVCIGAICLLVLGLLGFIYCEKNLYWFEILPDTPFAFFGCVGIFAAMTFLGLRRSKNDWTLSLGITIICSLGFMGTLYSGIQLEASLYGQREIRVFVLQAPEPDKPSDKPSDKIHVWKSGDEEDAEQPILRLETYARLARQPYQPGDQIELPVRRGIFNQYVLDIKDGYVYFKSRNE